MKVTIRDEEWFFHDDGHGGYWLQPSRKDGKVLRYPYDLTEQETEIVRVEWKAETEERKRQNAIYAAKYEAQKKRDEEDAYRGLVQIDFVMWNVESDHIWRCGENGILRREFSELTNSEISRVIAAKERAFENRGLGGLVRRFLRKIDK